MLQTFLKRQGRERGKSNCSVKTLVGYERVSALQTAAQILFPLLKTFNSLEGELKMPKKGNEITGKIVSTASTVPFLHTLKK